MNNRDVNDFHVHHPTIWNFICKFKLIKFQGERDLDLSKFIFGEADVTKRAEYVRDDRNILFILERYDYDKNKLTIIEALNELSSTIECNNCFTNTVT